METSTIVIVLVLTLIFGLSFEAKITKFNETLDSYINNHYSYFIDANGPPTRTTEDGRGGEILIYEYSKENTTPGRLEGRSVGYGHGVSHSATYTPPVTTTKTTTIMLWVNSYGYIYRWYWEGGGRRYSSE